MIFRNNFVVLLTICTSLGGENGTERRLIKRVLVDNIASNSARTVLTFENIISNVEYNY